MIAFRPLVAADLGAIHALEVVAYVPSLLVSDEAFLRLIEIFPDGAIGALDEHGLCGYAFGVPLTSGTALDLHVPLAAVPADADVFYIHDVAVAARCRAQGLGRQLASRMLALARERNFTRVELVSVQGSDPFWARFGFRIVRTFEYAPGATAHFMAAGV